MEAGAVEDASVRLRSDILKCSVSATSDKGTEAGIAGIPPTLFSSFFPYFSEQHSFDADNGDQNDAMPEFEDSELSTPFTLNFGGKLHIVSRLTKGLLSAMPCYSNELQDLLGALTKFLNAPWMLERLRNQCFDGRLAPMAFLFDSFPWTLVNWRWFSFCPVVEELLQRKQALRAGWSLDKLRYRGEARRDGDDDDDADSPAAGRAGQDAGGGVNIEDADKAVNSNLFWGWLQMAGVLVKVVTHVEGWFMSCPCHSRTVGATWSQRVRHFSERLNIDEGPCPMVGRRLPELACGEFDTFSRICST